MVILSFILGSVQLQAGKKDKDALYLAAITEQNPEIKMQKLEEYMEKYGKKKKNQTAPLFINLVETAYKLKAWDKLLSYSTMAFDSGKLSEIDQMNVKLKLAYYNMTAKKDLATAEKLADEILEFGKKLNNAMCDKMFCAPALRIKIAILEAQATSSDAISKALDASFEVYKIDKSQKSADFIFYFAQKAYNELGQYDKAIAALEKICDAPNAKEEHMDKLAAWYMSDGYNDKALKYYEKSYTLTKNAQKAYLVGKLTYKNNLTKGLNYLAESFVLDEAPYSDQAKELMEEAYKESQPEETTPEQIDEAIQQMIEDARVRLNK